jgi:muramidase (phage lysozyme)
MPTFGDTPVPEDIVREGITNDEVAFLKESFSQEASDKGLVASFQETAQPDGLMTLVTHFARRDNVPTSPPGVQAAAPSAGSGNNPPAPGQNATLTEDQQVTRFRPMLNFIAQHEGTANQPGSGYNTSLGFGIFIGGEKTLVGMTLLQIDVLQTQMLNNPQNHFHSSALGRYQIVRTTLRSLKIQLRLSQTALFDQALQDKLGVALILGRGRNVAGLRLEWASLQNVSSTDILAAYDADGSARA